MNLHDIQSGSSLCLHWSAARLAKGGRDECGDAFLVKEIENKVLAAAIDGVGHGKKAEKASQAAIRTLETFKDGSLISLVEYCHKELRKTRGVVMSLVLFEPAMHTMSWISVGNVEGVLLQTNGQTRRRNIILRGGIVGYQLPPLQASVFPVSDGDLLILTTDGVENNYIDHIRIDNSTRDIVEYISSHCFKQTDDALIFVARYDESLIK